MGTKCLHDLKLHISIFITRVQQDTFMIQHLLCWGQIYFLVCVKEHPKKKIHQNLQKCQPKIMTVYGMVKKRDCFQQKSCSVPSPSHHPLEFAQVFHKIKHDFTGTYLTHEYADRSKHPTTCNNTHCLPMNEDSDVTHRTLRNNLKLQGNVSAHGQELKIGNIEKT